MENFEKLGVFYLGRPFDLAKKKLRDGIVLYDSRDLVTHAVCVGMTGSGKTGLCVALIEEAALDGIPAILIDPKGDLANLLLTFPDLEPADFRPWINEEDAARKGVSADDYAREQAALWKSGLAEWAEEIGHLGPARRARLGPVPRGGRRRGATLEVAGTAAVLASAQAREGPCTPRARPP
jgi:DNA helicase HerA-like ATPase